MNAGLGQIRGLSLGRYHTESGKLYAERVDRRCQGETTEDVGLAAAGDGLTWTIITETFKKRG